MLAVAGPARAQSSAPKSQPTAKPSIAQATPTNPTATPPAASVRILSVTDAVRLATSDNVALRAKGWEVKSVQANEVTASLRQNPVFGYNLGNINGKGTLQHSLSIGQPIELGDKRAKRVESALAGSRAANYEFADVQRQLQFQVKSAFTNIQVAEAAVALATENLKALDEVEGLQRLRAQRGDISDLDLLRIQGQRFAFERDAADARQAVKASKIQLRTLISPDRLPEDFDISGSLSFVDVRLSRADIYTRAIDNRPDVKAAQASGERARADIDVARESAIPDIVPSISYGRQKAENQTFGIGFSIALPAFDRNQGEIARARADAERVELNRQAVVQQAQAEIDTAISALDVARTKVSALRDNYLPKARQVREKVEFAYRRGGASLLDYLDAERSLRDASLTYINSLGDYQTAVYQLETAVGGSLE